MKKYIFIAVLIVCGMVATAATATEPKNNVPNKPLPISVTFDDSIYFLKYSSGNQNEWLNEYLPKDATFENYHYMFTVRSYDGLVTTTPQDIGSSVIYNLQQNYPGAKYAFFSGIGKDAGLQFFIRQGNILEFNTFRFTMKNGRPLALQFVYREYVTPDNEQAIKEKMGKELEQKMGVWKEKILTMPVPTVHKQK